MRILTIFLLGCVSASCATAIDTPIGCPSAPDVWAYEDVELWRATPEQIRGTIVHNEAAWEAWYDAACSRIEDHDARFQ